MPQQEAATNRPFSRSFIRLLIGVATAVVVSVLLMGTQQAARAQSVAPQVYCGTWEVEPNYSLESETRRDGEWQYWNYRWCHSPEVSGGWYKDYAGYSLTAPDATLTITASADSVAVGEPVSFHLTQTNNEPNTPLSPVVTFLEFPYFSVDYEVGSSTSSRGQCTFTAHARGGVGCELGTLPPGGTAYMVMVVVPQEPGTLTAAARTNFGVVGGAAAPLSPRTEANVTVDPA